MFCVALKNSNNLNSVSIITKVLNSSNSISIISITPPFTIINSLPFDMRVYFNIVQKTEDKDNTLISQNPNLVDLFSSMEDYSEDSPLKKQISMKYTTSNRFRRIGGELKPIEENQSEDEDSKESEEEFFDAQEFIEIPKKYEYVDLWSGDEISLLDTNPENEFFISVQPLSYKASNFMNIKDDLEEVDERNEEEKANFNQELNDDQILEEYKKTWGFRFMKKKTILFQTMSKA